MFGDVIVFYYLYRQKMQIFSNHLSRMITGKNFNFCHSTTIVSGHLTVIVYLLHVVQCCFKIPSCT